MNERMLESKVRWAICVLVVVWAVLRTPLGDPEAGLFGFTAFLAVVGGPEILRAAAEFIEAVRGSL